MAQFTVPEVPGSSRTSLRTYTHAVIGRLNGELVALAYEAEHKANGARTRQWDIKHWEDGRRTSEAVAGQLYRNHNGYMTEAHQEIIDIYTEFMAKYPTIEAHLANQEALRLSHITKARAAGVGKLVVLQWSLSHKNAFKAIGNFTAHNSDVRVVEAQVVEKKSRVKAA